MKKIYQLLALVGFSMLAIGTYAQSPKNNPFAPSLKPIPSHIGRTGATRLHKVQGVPNNARINYVDGDMINNPGSYFHWVPPLYMNMNYTLADTITSPYNSVKSNINTANYCAVAYDTLWDDWTQTYLATPIAGTVTVDTIWMDLAYHNTSNTTDSIIFQVCAVRTKGFPSDTIYGSVTAHLTKVSLPYNVLDSLQSAYIVPATPISIPSNARHVWNFCIKMMVYGSKLDTLGVWYYSQGVSCGSFYTTNAYTAMGVVDGRAPAVNSFVSGLYWYNDTKNFGNNTQLTWPSYNEMYNGYCLNSGLYYWYDYKSPLCPDSSYYPVQDIALFPSIHFSTPLGANEITSNNFSVSQNFPNPFSRQTQITYSLVTSSDVTFSVYDIAGREIISNKYSAVAPGEHVISLNANQFSPGIYFYTFNVNGNLVTRKMVITE